MISARGAGRAFVSGLRVDRLAPRGLAAFQGALEFSVKRLQEDIMQINFKRSEAALLARRSSLSVAILTAALAICAAGPTYAACGVSHSSGVHAGGGAGGVHVATAASAPSGGAATGCATGASTPSLRGLTTTASGRVTEPGVHAAHAENHLRKTAARAPTAAARVHAPGPAHRA
jgi:hypothetical protein